MEHEDSSASAVQSSARLSVPDNEGQWHVQCINTRPVPLRVCTHTGTRPRITDYFVTILTIYCNLSANTYCMLQPVYVSSTEVPDVRVHAPKPKQPMACIITHILFSPSLCGSREDSEGKVLATIHNTDLNRIC